MQPHSPLHRNLLKTSNPSLPRIRALPMRGIFNHITNYKSEFERRKLMYPLISVFIIVVGALLLVFANKIIKNNKVNRIGIKVVGGILIIVGLLLLYFLLSGKLTLPLSK